MQMAGTMSMSYHLAQLHSHGVPWPATLGYSYTSTQGNNYVIWTQANICYARENGCTSPALQNVGRIEPFRSLQQQKATFYSYPAF